MAIAEQVSEPGTGLVEREVRRAVTKGTVVDPGMLDERRNNHLMAVALGHECRHRLLRHHHGRICRHADQRRQPRGSRAAHRRGDPRLQPSELIHVEWEPRQSTIHGLIDLVHPLLSTVESWQVEPDTAEASLKRHFASAASTVWAARPAGSHAQPRPCSPTSPRDAARRASK